MKSQIWPEYITLCIHDNGRYVVDRNEICFVMNIKHAHDEVCMEIVSAKLHLRSPAALFKYQCNNTATESEGMAILYC